ncbi:hypothetical protein Turpa_4011 [Turneriella parva DSM 21527]|uniref:Lipoprotein n=2 Tax=Turneriella TaxID=338321 RepID=I4BBI8_TURPD|nr:hypothetical protein Turpa_4011 [Turneriella parva DSM 21527]
MRLLLLIIPACFFAACSNATEPQSMLAKFQSSKWPVYETEVYLPEDGKAVKKTAVSPLIWPNELVSTTESNAEGARICRTVLSDTEDHHRRQCEAAGHKTLSLNTLDANGRIIATVYDPGNGEPLQTGQYEYHGDTETFYGYLAGRKDFTVLTEKWPGRKKYTTWRNADPSAPEIHVRDYEDSGEGSEFYIAASHGNMRETSRTRVFRRDTQKIKLTYVVSYENPGGLLEITTSDWNQSEGWLEQVYEMRPAQINLDAIADIDAARSFITSARLVRTKKISHKQPTA